MGLCLICVIVALSVDGIARVSFVEKVSKASFSEVAPHTMPVAPGAREEWLVLPYASMDARWWVLHTEKMLGDGDWRVRDTSLDNAPDGREVHWSSLLMWVLTGLAWLQSLGGNLPASSFLAEAALVAGPVMQGIFVGGLGLIVGYRYGLFAAMFYVVCLLTSYPIVRTFLMGEADHHGIVVCFAIGSVLCLLAGGCGLARRPGGARESDDNSLIAIKTARWWFAVSGVLGGASLWVSAATAIPILGGSALGGFLVCLVSAQKPARQTIRQELWLVWGMAGCLSSMGFYLLEYFPRHMGWRLEVNHPLYAFAWLGGAYLLSRFAAWRATGHCSVHLREVVLCLISAGLVLIPLLAIALRPDAVFWVSDKFLLALHKEYILEFQNLFTINRVSGGGLSWIIYYLWPVGCIISLCFLIPNRKLTAQARRGLLLLVPPLILTQTLTVIQVRWASAAFGLWSLCTLVILIDLALQSPRDTTQRWVLRGLIIWSWVTLGLTIVPQVALHAEEERTCLDAPISRDIAGNLLLRDVAHRLIQASPNRMPVVLSGPNASTELAYHGGLRTVGTLYWENMPGLKRAARIFCATDESDALRQLTEAGVTHIVVPSWDNFAEAYAKLLAKAEGRQEITTPFFKGIVEGDDCPVWLRPFAYPIPTDSGLDTNSVKIFAVLPQQSLFESFYYQGVYFFETERYEKARQIFSKAAQLRPSDDRPQLYLKEIDTKHPNPADG